MLARTIEVEAMALLCARIATPDDERRARAALDLLIQRNHGAIHRSMLLPALAEALATKSAGMLAVHPASLASLAAGVGARIGAV